jgi:TolB protein
MLAPDGRRIVYRRIVDGNSEVFVADAAGAGQGNLSRDPAFDGWPAWSPDGSLIASQAIAAATRRSSRST